jgi:hypothetical protein
MQKIVNRRIKLEMIKLVILIFFILLIVTAVNFYLFLSSILPLGIMLQKENLIRLSVFGVITGVLIFGITAMLVKWFTYTTLGPVPRLIKEIKLMKEENKYHFLEVRKKDKLRDLVDAINILIENLCRK